MEHQKRQTEGLKKEEKKESKGKFTSGTCALQDVGKRTWNDARGLGVDSKKMGKLAD
jgi:hypothetical protein